MASTIHRIQIEKIIHEALREDWGQGDWTTDLCVASDKQSKAKIICKEEITVAGTEVARLVFLAVDSTLKVDIKATDGQIAEKSTVLLEISGLARSILKAERVALNFFAKMCGIASLTRKFVHQLEGTEARLLDTRKTTPGLRVLEKYSARVGGALNHRQTLSDGIIVKENHLRAAGGISLAVEKLRQGIPPGMKIEVEVTNFKELNEALICGVDIIMLDNMSIEDMKKAVAIVDKKAFTEASGNVSIDNCRKIAETGVNFISTGAVFHSSKWSDLSLLFEI